jgi:hypothetical protein
MQGVQVCRYMRVSYEMHPKLLHGYIALYSIVAASSWQSPPAHSWVIFLKPRILQYIHLAMGSSFWVEAVSGNARSTAQLQTATYIGYIFSVSLNMSVIV